MDSLLQSLNSVPGVVGCVLADERGNCLDSSFPGPMLDPPQLQALSAALAQGATGLKFVGGGVELLDMVFAEGRLVARRLPRATLLMLCARSTNLELLTLHISVLSDKLNALEAQPAAAVAPAPPPPAAAAPPSPPLPAPAPAPAVPPAAKAAPAPAGKAAPEPDADEVIFEETDVALSEKDRAERKKLTKVLLTVGGNKSVAAKLLGLTEKALLVKLKKYGLAE